MVIRLVIPDTWPGIRHCEPFAELLRGARAKQSPELQEIASAAGPRRAGARAPDSVGTGFAMTAFCFRFKTVLLVMLLGYHFIACKKTEQPDDPQGEVALADVVNTFGGITYLDQIHTLGYNVMGTTVEYEQSGPMLPGPVTTSAYRYQYLTVLNQRKASFIYSLVNFTYPIFLNAPPYKMIINDTVGVVDGYFDWKYYYTDTNPKSPLYASRIEAVLKNQYMSNPIALLKDLRKGHDLQQKSHQHSFTLPSQVAGLDIRLTVDPKTLLPTEASIMEEDFLSGDVIFSVEYREWQRVANAWYPFRIFYKLDGNIIREEILSEVMINPSIPAETFNISPADTRPYDAAAAKLGYLTSQWYNRLSARGMIYDEPMGTGAVAMEEVDLSDIGVGSQRISDNVRIIGRQDLNLWSVAIQTENGITVVEAPLNPIWTGSIMRCIHKKYPQQHIIGVIPTHTHSDHLGGIREIMPEAKKIYVVPEAVPIVEKALGSQFSIPLDSLSRSAKNWVVEEVRGIRSIENGQIQIHQFKKSDPFGLLFAVDNSHAFDMVIVYVPAEKLIIQGDVFNAGTFLNILKGKTPRQFLPPVRAEFKKRATFLLDYIHEKQLDVDKVIGIHGGLVKLEEVEAIANN